ncbi:MAG: VWA domain-containing protein, partial [Parabacteroides sp.]|nr:VWA domain-containing protein [Parabacteroides sp.]
GINQFNYQASWVYPEGSGPAASSVSPDRKELLEAAEKIDYLQAGGMTNITDAFRLSYQMLDKGIPADIKAFVLISDGEHNAEQAKPESVYTGYPPLSIGALGYWMKESYFKPLINKNPKENKYYHAEKKEEMIKMFYDIRGAVPNAILLANEQQAYQGMGYQLVPATVCSASGKAQFSVAWPDKKYKYTSGRPNGYNINVQLIDPKGHHRTDKPTIAGDGYCIFDLKDAQSGEWDVLVQYDLSQPAYGTVGAFQLDVDIKTAIIAPSILSAGQPVPLDVEVSRNGNPLENLKIQATVKRPAISIENALKKYASRLKDIRLEGNEINPEIPEEIERLRLLHTQLLPQEDILPVYSSFHTLAYSPAKGLYENTFTETHEAGSYSIQVKITGTDPKTGQPVTWLKNQSVLIG